MTNQNNLQLGLPIHQSSGLSFSFITSIDKLIINSQYLYSRDRLQWIGQISYSPIINFSQIKAYLQKGQFQIELISVQRLKIKIGCVPLDILSVSKSLLMNDPMIALKKSHAQQENMQPIINSHKNTSHDHQQMINHPNSTVLELKQNIKALTTQMIELNRKLHQKVQNPIQNLRSQTSYIKNDSHLNETKLTQKQSINQELLKKVTATQQAVDESNKNFRFLRKQISELKQESKKFKENVNQQIDHLNKIIKSQSDEIIHLKTKAKENQLVGKKVVKNESKSQFFEKEINDKKDELVGIKEANIQSTPQDNQIIQVDVQYQEQESEQEAETNQQNQIIFWNQQFKSTFINISGNLATLENQSHYGQFCMIDTPLSRTLNRPKQWKIKIKQRIGLIGLGIGVKKLILEHNFNDMNINWSQISREFYMVNSAGFSFSHSSSTINNKNGEFIFNENDIISIEYNPIDWKLKFRKANDYHFLEMQIIPPPYDGEYCPFVMMNEQEDEVELIQTDKNESMLKSI